MLRPPARYGGDHRRRGAGTQHETKPHALSGRAGRPLRGNPARARGGAGDRRRLSFTSKRSIRSVGNRSRAAHRSVDVSRHHFARARHAHGAGVPPHRRELQSARTRPCALGRMSKWFFVLMCLGVSSAAAQDVSPQQPPAGSVLREIHVEGATIFNREDIVWLLELREGSPLPKLAGDLAQALKEAYERDGYAEATVTGTFDRGRLTLSVDEGRIDDIEILGVTAA